MSRKCQLHPGFETQGRRYQKSKTGVSVAPQKGHVSSKNFRIKKKKRKKDSVHCLSHVKRCQMPKSQTAWLWMRFIKFIKVSNIMGSILRRDMKIIKLFQKNFWDVLKVFSDHHMWPQNWPHCVWTSLCNGWNARRNEFSKTEPKSP